jgi:hypothetical protein
MAVFVGEENALAVLQRTASTYALTSVCPGVSD